MQEDQLARIDGGPPSGKTSTGADETAKSRAPTLVVVSGPAASGKTTLAHALARKVGCPAICRDEIKEGMVHAAPRGVEAAPGDPLTVRTESGLSHLLGVLVEAGVTCVAEAAFQDGLWRHVLEPVQDRAELRIIRCTVDARTGWERGQARDHAHTTRAAHSRASGLEDWTRFYDSFEDLSLPAPCIEVDTTDGYAPSLADVAAFVNCPAQAAETA